MKVDPVFRRKGISLQFCFMLGWLGFAVYATYTVQIFMPGLAEVTGVPYANLLNWQTVGNLIAILGSFLISAFISRVGGNKIIAIFAIIAGLNFMFMPYYGHAVGVGCALNALCGICYCSVPSSLILGNWYPRKHAHVMGNVTSVILFASVAFLPIFNVLVNRIGLNLAMMVYGLPFVAYGIACFFWVKNTPEELGLDPDGIPWESEEEKEKFTAVEGEKSPWTIRQIFTNKSILCISIAWGMFFMVLSAFNLVGVNMLTAKAVPDALSVAMASISGVIGFGVSIGSGYLSDKIGHMVTSIILIVILGVGCLLLWVMPVGSVVALCLGFVMGLCCTGAGNNLQPTAVLKLAGPRWYASVFKWSNCITLCIRAFGTMIFSFSLTRTGGYNAALALCVVMCIVFIILMLIGGDKLQEPREIKKKKVAE